MESVNLYKYVNFKDYTIESLKEHYFWLTNPSDLNDPSEGQVITQYDVTDQQKVDWYKFESLYQYLFVSSANKEQIYILLKNMGLTYEYVQAIMNFHNQDSLMLCKTILEKLDSSFPVNQLQIDNKQFISKIDAAINAYKTKKSSQTDEERRKYEVQNIGILSLTTDYTNTLMWAHYANNHSGFCIGYEVFQSDKTKNNFLISCEDSNKYFDNNHINFLKNCVEAKKVEYSEKNIIFNPFIFNPDPITNSLFCKSKEWEYEKEYRVVRANMNHLPDKEFRKLHYPKNILKKIIFGFKTDQEKIAEIKSIINTFYGNTVSFYKTQYDYNKRTISNNLIEL